MNMITDKIKRSLFILCTVLLITGVGFPTAAGTKSIHGKLKAGDIVYFGKYEQDGNTKNGRERIEWRVLEKRGGKLLLLSKHVLDLKPYHTEEDNITWEKCSLRKWLNHQFIKSAFTEKERKRIRKTKMENKDNKGKMKGFCWDSKGGSSTWDKVFLLSIDEAKRYLKTEQNREGEITDYGIRFLGQMGELSEEELRETEFKENRNWSWWLRSPGYDQHRAGGILYDGSIEEGGFEVDQYDVGIRVAVWID